jgi:hypothetical protein
MITRKLFLTTIAASMLVLLSAPSYALPVMDVRIEDLVLQASDVRKSLNLNPNQQILWQQVESRVRMILRTRQSRRERLQVDIKLGLDDSKIELRELAKRLDAEDDLSNQESKQLRELWLTVNDALDDNQRQIILVRLADQLQRSADQKTESNSNRQKGDARGRGMNRQKPGGMNSGMP